MYRASSAGTKAEGKGKSATHSLLVHPLVLVHEPPVQDLEVHRRPAERGEPQIPRAHEDVDQALGKALAACTSSFAMVTCTMGHQRAERIDVLGNSRGNSHRGEVARRDGIKMGERRSVGLHMMDM